MDRMMTQIEGLETRIVAMHNSKHEWKLKAEQYQRAYYGLLYHQPRDRPTGLMPTSGAGNHSSNLRSEAIQLGQLHLREAEEPQYVVMAQISESEIIVNEEEMATD